MGLLGVCSGSCWRRGSADPSRDHSAVPPTPNVTEINQHGSFALEFPRLAFIDGSADRKLSRAQSFAVWSRGSN